MRKTKAKPTSISCATRLLGSHRATPRETAMAPDDEKEDRLKDDGNRRQRFEQSSDDSCAEEREFLAELNEAHEKSDHGSK